MPLSVKRPKTDARRRKERQHMIRDGRGSEFNSPSPLFSRLFSTCRGNMEVEQQQRLPHKIFFIVFLGTITQIRDDTVLLYRNHLRWMQAAVESYRS
ncbi:hypothetical protein DAI22_03g051300 [Oryza sativa Japonica Group]|nr:hypothetical protein DAI22_03g051300 [Oryza sativa Japonica Group]